MAAKDIKTKRLESFPDVFADIFNTLVFHGAVIDPARLMDAPTESIYKDLNGTDHSQYRDEMKYYTDDKCLLMSMFGLENQTSVERLMPVRAMSYDTCAYKSQVQGIPRSDKKVKLCPVVSIILNFSNHRWNQPTSLKELMNIPKWMEGYVQDYKILVFDIAFLEDEVIERFQSDFKVVARFFKNRRIKGDIGDPTELKHVESVLELLSAFTQDQRYKEAIPSVLECVKKGKGANMCTIVDSLIQKGEEIGIQKGEEIGRRKAIADLVWDGALTLSEGAKRLNITEKEMTDVMNAYPITEDQKN